MNQDHDDSFSSFDADTEEHRENSASEARRNQDQPEAPTRSDKRKRFSWLPGRRPDNEEKPSVSRCVVIGPTAAGKTQLLASLRRCDVAQSHSYATRYTLSFGGVNDDFRRLDRWLGESYARGLKLEGTQTGDCYLPQFTLRVITETGWPRRTFDTKFRTFEGAGGLLEERNREDVRLDPGYQRCRKLLDDALDDEKCNTVLICVPIVGWVKAEQERELQDLIDMFLGRRKIRTLVVCMTMYEKLGIELGRNAYRELATRSAARTAIGNAFDRRLRGLERALRQFAKRSKRNVWCVPVSSYGFVPFNGGANLSITRAPDGDTWSLINTLRTIPTPTDDELRELISERPYSEEQAYKTYWRPFLTLDPFAFIATGDRTGTLIHHYNELGR